MNRTLADGQLAASAGTLYTPTEQIAVDTALCNTSASLTETVILRVTRVGSSARRVVRAVLAPNEQAIIRGLQLNAGDILDGSASNATTVDYTVFLSAGGEFGVVGYDATGAVKQVNTGISGSQSVSGNQTIAGAVVFSGVVTPTPLAGSGDDLAIGAVSIVRIATDGNGGQNLTGMVPTANGQLVLIHNVGTADSVTIKHSATSAAANQFIGPNSSDVTLRKNGSVHAWYDGVSTKWRLMGA